ncbi:Vacuolar protein sorting-associated protein 41 [Diatrype stigma]|uniref:Vacuolar protein sorting-associated protein 41 n=1 Tax=Diatrype stigma TaxID=117547 RepID=A0AAN9UUA4_9PEZI
MTTAQPKLGDDSNHENENEDARVNVTSTAAPEHGHPPGEPPEEAPEIPDPSREVGGMDGSKTHGHGNEKGNNGLEGEGADEEEEEQGDDGDDDDDDDDDDDGDDEEDEEEEEEEEEEDDEPKLKYARLTQHLNPVYRNGDATSAFLVVGDKMIVGTHNGNINVIQLPTFQSLRVYHAHSASVTSISISPYPPPPLHTSLKPDAVTRAMAQTMNRPSSQHSTSSFASLPAGKRRPREAPQVPNVPSNNIHIATSSMDGNVCIQSLIDMKDVQLRNFARPVQAVALSPDYKNDRTYLSGGTAGSLVLTVGAPQGKSTSTTVGTAAAAASGWLGSIGIGGNSGKDTILHSGEGTISTIKWSLSGKYVVWLNEHGIKIMRSKLHLESADAEDAWKRIGHIDRPQTDEWEEMAGVWKGRAEWIDEQSVESDEEDTTSEPTTAEPQSPAAIRLKQQAQQGEKKIERLLVGWGGTIWIIHVHPGGMGVVLAYCKPDEEDDNDEPKIKHVKGHKTKTSTTSSGSGPSGGIRRRQNAQPPELRLIDLTSQAEVDKDGLTVGRFERLSSNDYHLGVLPANKAASVVASRGALEALAGFGSEIWNATINPRSLFNSGASIKSGNSNDAASATKVGSTPTSARFRPQTAVQTVHPSLIKPGAKIFIHSPYDCILATRRDLADHLQWLLEHQKHQEAWELLDEHPEILGPQPDSAEQISTPDKRQSFGDDFFDDISSAMDAQLRFLNSSTEKEKRRISDLWIQGLVDEQNWDRAAEVIGRVVNTPDRWEKWIYVFAGAKKFDEIANYMPSEPLRPPIPGTVYEIVLSHYIQKDKLKFKELLDHWEPELFEAREVITVLENQLKFRDVREDSVEDGEKGRDWRIVMESLARLYELNGRYREALRNYIKLQDADSAMRLIKENHLADAVTDDVPSFISLRVPDTPLSRMGLPELEEATAEAIALLVDEAQRGLIPPSTVVHQLEKKGLNTYLYFYLRGLWREYRDRPVDETVSLVDEFADLAVRIFASFDRDLLMDFLRVSTSYNFEQAVLECQQANYIPELVYLYSKTGRTKQALYLIIDRLSDVSQAIAFAKEQDDPDLWEDLLNYSMDKPRFIRGLLEEVGTAIDPLTLIRRIPEGLEIPGLREGLQHMMKEHEIQFSISSGVARVLRSEVAAAQNLLRTGQRQGIKFEVAIDVSNNQEKQNTTAPPAAAVLTSQSDGTHTPTTTTDTAASTAPANGDMDATGATTAQDKHEQSGAQDLRPGHCAQCRAAFVEWELEALVGFACGHVFHVSHLFELLHPGDQQPLDPALLGRPIDDSVDNDDLDRSRGGRFVGSKVTHARLLRDHIQKGCPVCKRRRDDVAGGQVSNGDAGADGVGDGDDWDEDGGWGGL